MMLPPIPIFVTSECVQGPILWGPIVAFLIAVTKISILVTNPSKSDCRMVYTKVAGSGGLAQTATAKKMAAWRARQPGRGEPPQLHTKLWCSVNADMLKELAASMTMREAARHLRLKLCELQGYCKSLGIENAEWKAAPWAPRKLRGPNLTLEVMEQVCF